MNGIDIVVVEDEYLLRKAVCASLQDEFPTAAVHQAGDYRSGVDILRRVRGASPQNHLVVLSDVQYPGGGGEAMATHVREQYPQASFGLMTAGSVDAAWMEGIPVLCKPFRPDTMVAFLQPLLKTEERPKTQLRGRASEQEANAG